VLGDLHIPHRKDEIPALFKDLLVRRPLLFVPRISRKYSQNRCFAHQVPGKMQHVLCTGNVCSKSQDDYLRTLANSVHVVRGDMDNASGASWVAVFTLALCSFAVDARSAKFA
jgi:vacuolar protein sorting-associated protein 29